MVTAPLPDRPRSAPTPIQPRIGGPRLAAAPLPRPLSSLIGREQIVTVIGDLLRRDDVRLVALTGPGGVGKTRLAIQAAAEAEPDFDGVVWVALADLADPGAVASAVAAALGVRLAGDRAPLTSLTIAMRDDRLLLVLDNFEQLLDAAPFVAELLATCSNLTILVTSRERLRLSGERVFPVPPLSLTSRGVEQSRSRAEGTVNFSTARLLDSSTASEAVRLFAARAEAVFPDFALTDDSAPLVEAICRRLDGLPLAIELAAARVGHLPLPALLARLDRPLPLLTGGARDLPDRLQTMRNAIAWSYDLLTPEEQRVFRRLSVFVGGCTLEAAEAVGVGFDLLASLVDKSLVVGASGPLDEPAVETRYRVLETIREFAAERLEVADEGDDVRRAHATHFLALAERHPIAPAPWFPPDDQAWLAELEADHANVRAALAWLEEHGDPTEHARFAAAIGWQWCGRGRAREARAALELGLGRGDRLPPMLRVRIANVLGTILLVLGEHERAGEVVRAALDLARAESDDLGTTAALLTLGVVAQAEGDYARSTACLTEALALARSLADRRMATAMVSAAQANLGVAARGRGLLAEAATHHEQALEGYRAVGLRLGEVIALGDLGDVARDAGTPALALRHYQAALPGAGELGEQRAIVELLDGIADAAAVLGFAGEATRLFGAAERLRGLTGLTLRLPVDRAADERGFAAARMALGESEFAAAWAAGRALTLDQAIAAALAIGADPAPAMDLPSAPAAPLGVSLTAREREILPLIAAGKTDREIAAALFIGRRTVESHVARLLAKLGVTTRTAAARAAVAGGLVGAKSTAGHGDVP